MRTIQGVYTSAVIFNTASAEHSIDDYAVAQLQALCDNRAFEGCKVRVMPDVHPGKVGVIGFTSTLGTEVLPNVIGADMGCGVTAARIRGRFREFQRLDTLIRENVPSGFSVRSRPHRRASDFDLTRLACHRHINERKALLSLGTLGGGNHFIELDREEDGEAWLLIHTGSRHLGQEITEHYLREGQRVLRAGGCEIPYELTWLEGSLMEDYLHDLAVAQEFAALNRDIILGEIADGMKWKITETFSCVHNYVDFEADVPMIRKGAIAAKKGEHVVIPVNMRDGAILGRGLGNEDWNCSAPHGAGRIMKREEVGTRFTVSAFKSQMKGIYSTCIGKETLDEAPFAYRDMESIADCIGETVAVESRIRPLYNFKAGGRQR